MMQNPESEQEYSRRILREMIDNHEQCPSEEDTAYGPGRVSFRECFWAQVAKSQGDSSHWDRFMLRVAKKAFGLQQAYTDTQIEMDRYRRWHQ